MIVAAVVNPHESTPKSTTPHMYTGGFSPMSGKDKIVIKQDQKSQELIQDDSVSESDGSDHSSEEFKLLTINDEGPEDANTSTPTTTTTEPTVAVPVKRVLRRKRKRMSEDERRIRHREVQRQFMKRKRARMGELRKVILGLEAQHRVLKVMHERETLEKQNAKFVELLAGPGSGWVWDDAASTQEVKHSETSELILGQVGSEPGLLPSQHQLLPTELYTTHLNPHYDAHYGHFHHQPHPDQFQHDAFHTVMPRPQAPGVPLPWDDILDAVTGDFTF